jgi:hypothetical protein
MASGVHIAHPTKRKRSLSPSPGSHHIHRPLGPRHLQPYLYYSPIYEKSTKNCQNLHSVSNIAIYQFIRGSTRKKVVHVQTNNVSNSTCIRSIRNQHKNNDVLLYQINIAKLPKIKYIHFHPQFSAVCKSRNKIYRAISREDVNLANSHIIFISHKIHATNESSKIHQQQEKERVDKTEYFPFGHCETPSGRITYEQQGEKALLLLFPSSLLHQKV